MTSAARIGREPIQKPGRSKQDYGTPMALIDAIEARWDALRWDLAATEENAKAGEFYSPARDALKQNWAGDVGDGIAWLNPPFGNIEPWAAKCVAETEKYSPLSIILLVPASIGAEWFARHCEGRPVIGLRPRITFEGCSDPYPKDCMLCVFGDIGRGLPLLSTWRWK